MWRIVQILTKNFFELLITIYFSATLPEQNTLISKSICKACTKMFFIKKNIIQMIWTTAVYILKTCACTKQFCKYYKQLLDEVFVISGIIKVKVSIIRISQKLNVIILLFYYTLFRRK